MLKCERPPRPRADDRPASILLVKDGLGIGGAETQLLALARGLRTLGHTVRVANLSSAATLEPDFLRAGVPVHHLARRGRFDLLPVLHLAWLAFTFRPSVVQSFHWLANLYAATALRLLPGSVRPPLVGALRGHYYLGRGGAQRARVDRLVAPWIDVMVANCQALLDHARAHGVRFNRTVAIYNGVAVPPAGPRARFDGEVRFAVVGRLAAVKRQRDVLLAAREVAGAYPEARFWFLGDGPDRAALEELAADLDLATRVRFFGEVAEPGEYLEQSDALVLASDHEGLPNAILEAMARGLPIVGTRVGGIPEVVEEGRNGLLVPPRQPAALASALSLLAADRDRRVRMGLASYAIVRARFTNQAMVASYRDLYATVGRSRLAPAIHHPAHDDSGLTALGE